MPGYWDTKKLITDTLVGRPVGTLIFPEGHQNFALSLLDYIRSVEILGASSLQGEAEQDTVPVQPDNARICYIATVPPNRFYTFRNFLGEDGQPIQVVSGMNTITFCTLLWNGEYWSVQTTKMYSGSQGGPQIGIRDLLATGTKIGILTINGVDYILNVPVARDGKSAYEIWLDEGNAGTEEDFIASLKGDTGVSADYPITIHNGTDSSATDEALSALQGKLLSLRIDYLSRRARPKTPSDYYPFVIENSTTKEFGQGIVEIYIDPEKHTSEDIRLRTFRYMQTGQDWEGNRTEIVIEDENGRLFNYLSYSTNQPNIQFFHTEDYSICLIVNWSAFATNVGYGAFYDSSADKKLDDEGVKEIENSPIIRLFLENIKRAEEIEAINNALGEIGLQRIEELDWLEYGIESGGEINYNSDEEHTSIEGVNPGALFIFDKGIYRVNLFKDGVFIKQDTDFLPQPSGETHYQSPSDVDFDMIMVSRVGDYLTEVNNVRIIRNINTLISILDNKIDQKQDYIKGNLEEVIDISPYVQNGSVDNQTGELSPFRDYRSLIGFPLPNDKNLIILNPVDKISNKRISFWDSNDNLTRIIVVTDMSNYNLVHTSEEVKANITLISGLAPYPERIGEIVVGTSTDEQAKIDKINGIPLDIPDIPAGAVSDIKAAGTLLPKDGTIINIPNASSTQSGLLSPTDKAKLDLVRSGDITINGSGVTKNASAFGFLPTKTASENVAALQSAVNGGGTILIDFPGTYLVNGEVLIESNTKLIFGAGVFISLQAERRFLINKNAINRTYDENISVIGLNLISNRRDIASNIYGLRGYLAFFYVKNLYISYFQLLDGGSNVFVIHICTFENVVIENIRIEGNKDAVHFGRGSKFVVRHGLFKTYDDPIALNAHDYPSSNPEYGDIVDGLIEDCYDLADANTTGYFARLLPGAWVDWFSGMSVHSFGDTVVSEGRIYVTAGTMGSTLISTVKPTFTSGKQTLSDGVTWNMQQDSGVGYSATCRNIYFRNIYLQKDRDIAINAMLDNGPYSRSYYPNAVVPVLRNIILQNIQISGFVVTLFGGSAPIDSLKLIDSDTTRVSFGYTSETGLVYPVTNLIMIGDTFRGSGNVTVISGNANRSVIAKIMGSIVDNGLNPNVSNVNLISNDIGI